MSTLDVSSVTAAAARLHEATRSVTDASITVSADDIREVLSFISQAGNPSASENHAKLLGQMLGECIVTAGITHPDAPLSGPELLMFGKDLRNHLVQLEQGQEAFNAVISYILSNRNESPLDFLRCWNEGNFEALRKEWSDAPEEIYIGPDTLHPMTIGFGKDAPDSPPQLTASSLLTKCRDSLADGLESSGESEAEFSVNDRELIAEVDAFLANLARI